MEDYIGLVYVVLLLFLMNGDAVLTGFHFESGQTYPRVAQAPELQVKLFGSWITEFGELDQAGKAGCHRTWVLSR